MAAGTLDPFARSWGRRSLGLGLVGILHIALVGALVTALARRPAIVMPTLVETTILSEPPAPPRAPAPPVPQVVPSAPQAPQVEAAPPPKPPPPRPAPQRSELRPEAPPVPPPHAVAAPPVAAAPVRVAPHLDAAASRQPDYPPLSRQLGEQGSVILQVLVGNDGRALDAKLAQSSGYTRLDAAALTEIKADYRFVPGSVDGKPQPMWLTIKYTWKLE